MSQPSAAQTAGVACAGCGLPFPLQLLACPRCQKLVYADELAKLAQRAEEAARAGHVQAALGLWRSALEKLPAGTKQHQQVLLRIEALGRLPETAPVTKAEGASQPRRKGLLVGLGALGLLLWKVKFIPLLLLSKVKLLLLGFTKIGTVISGLAAFGLYWTLWGWKFALGFVLSIYVHEMGHVAALRRYGIAATAPMFIPGLGAFVRLKQGPANVREDAFTGLAGPLWGLGAALVAWAVGALGGGAFWFALARAGALLNAFNLLPLGSLDGGRGFRALDRRHRWGICAVMAATLLVSGEPMLILLLGVAVVRALQKDAPTETERDAFLLFGAILLGLGLLLRIPVPGVATTVAAP